jgi:hypothetical protein
MIAVFAANRTRKVQYQVSYEGTLIGRAIRAHVKRLRQDSTQDPPTLLSGNPDVKILMVVVEGQNEIQAMEISHASDPRFYVLRRVSPTLATTG